MKDLLIHFIYKMEDYLITKEGQHSAADLRSYSLDYLWRLFDALVLLAKDVIE